MSDSSRDKRSQSRKAPATADSGTDLRGGAVIDANGREVPITEAMIEQALHELEYNNQGLGNNH